MNGRSNSGLSVAVCGVGVLLVAVGLWAAFAVVEPREAEGDWAYLANYRFDPWTEEQVALGVMRGSFEGIDLPYDRMPPAWLAPELHGPFVLVPNGWRGPMPAGYEQVVVRDVDRDSVVQTSELEVLRASGLWREPVLPEGYSLVRAYSEELGFAMAQVWETSGNVLELMWWEPLALPIEIGTSAGEGRPVFSRTWIDGSPGVTFDLSLAYPGVESRTVWVYREGEGGEPGMVYVAYSSGGSVSLTKLELIEVVRSLWESAR